MEMHIIPPAPRNADVPVSKEMAAENSRRMAVEDSIRAPTWQASLPIHPSLLKV